MGLKQGLEVLVGAARLDPKVRFVLMGDGSQRSALADLSSDVPNLDIIPPAADGEFPDILAAADVLAVTQHAAVLDMSVPSKLTSYFQTGRPVVAPWRRSGTAQEVERSGAGVLVPPEDPEALLKAVRASPRTPRARTHWERPDPATWRPT